MAAKHGWSERLKYVGEVSFGIFFIHGYFLVAIKMALLGWAGEEILKGNVGSYLIFAAFIATICCISLFVVQKTFGKQSRYLFGV